MGIYCYKDRYASRNKEINLQGQVLFWYEETSSQNMGIYDYKDMYFRGMLI